MGEPVKLTINEVAIITVTDSSGRVLTLKEPSVLAPYDLVEMLGAQASENHIYMSMVFPLLYLSAIDGEQVLQPTKKSEIKALIQRLGHDGVKTLRKGVEDNFGISYPETENAEIKK